MNHPSWILQWAPFFCAALVYIAGVRSLHRAGRLYDNARALHDDTVKYCERAAALTERLDRLHADLDDTLTRKLEGPPWGN